MAFQNHQEPSHLQVYDQSLQLYEFFYKPKCLQELQSFYLHSKQQEEENNNLRGISEVQHITVYNFMSST